MRKKFLIIVISIILAVLLSIGVVIGIYFSKKEKDFLKTEINGIIFETMERAAYSRLDFVDEDEHYSYYKFFKVVNLKISITNTNDLDFSFQVGSLSCGVYDKNDNGIYPFTFKSLIVFPQLKQILNFPSLFITSLKLECFSQTMHPQSPTYFPFPVLQTWHNLFLNFILQVPFYKNQ